MGVVVKFATVDLPVIALDIQTVANGADTLTLTRVTRDGTGIPLLDDDVEVWEDGVLIHAGEVEEPTREQFGDALTPVEQIQCNVGDYTSLLERRSVSFTIPAQSLYNVMVQMTTLLAPYGVTLDPTQVNPGPSIPEISTDFKNAKEVMDLVAKAAGNYVYEVTPSKLFRSHAPTADTAPFNITDTNRKTVGSVSVAPKRDLANFANRIIVRIPLMSTEQKDTLTAAVAWVGTAITAMSVANPTHVTSAGHGLVTGQLAYIVGSNATPSADGFWNITKIDNDHFTVPEHVTIAGTAGTVYSVWGQTVFPLSRVYASDPGYLTIDGVPNISMASGSWRAETDSTSPSGWSLVGNPQVEGTVIEFTYTSLFAGSITVEDATALTHPWEKVIQAPDGTSEAAGTALGTAALAASLLTPRTIIYRTPEIGLRAGQQQDIQCTEHGIPVAITCLLSQVDYVLVEWDGAWKLMKTVTAVEGGLFQGSFRDTYTAWSGGSTSAGAAAGGGGTIVVGGSKLYYWFGGSATEDVMATGGWDAATSVVVVPSRNCNVRVMPQLRATSGSVVARMWDIDDATVAGTSDAVTNTAYVFAPFGASLVAGKRYRIELQGTAGAVIGAITYAEEL